MSYNLEFVKSAHKEWAKLDNSVKSQFKKKIKTVLDNPRVAKNALSTMPDCYKIKLRTAGFRLVYKVEDATITVVVITVGKRENNSVYRNAKQIIDKYFKK